MTNRTSFLTVGLAALALAGSAGARNGGRGPHGGSPDFFGRIAGTVTAVGNGTLTVQVGGMTGQSVQVSVLSTTQIQKKDSVDIGQLAMGDQLNVHGRPGTITADALQSPSAAAAAGGTTGGTTAGTTGTTAGTTGTTAGTTGTTAGTTGGTTGGTTAGMTPTPPVSASAEASGAVSGIDATSRIVTLVLNDKSTLAVNVPMGVMVSRTRTIDLAGVKVNDTVQLDATLVASSTATGGFAYVALDILDGAASPTGSVPAGDGDDGVIPGPGVPFAPFGRGHR